MLAEPIETSVATSGVSPASVWLDQKDAVAKGVRRCDALLRMAGDRQDFSLLDVGCGPGLGIAYLEDRYGSMRERYLGVDISAPLVEAAREAWPEHRFEMRDIIASPLPELSHDFTLINGVLTARYAMTNEEMESFAMELLRAAWGATKTALSFNVMSPHVDWTREDLFHWQMDRAAAFCIGQLSRHVNILADYGLYEYTVQVFREPHPQGPIPSAWLRP